MNTALETKPTQEPEMSETTAPETKPKNGSSSLARISEKSMAMLRKIAKEDGKTMQAVLDEAIDEYDAKRFFRLANASYQALRNDPVAWAEELEERRLLEGTLMDGIDRNEIWHSDGTVTILTEEEAAVA